VSELKFVVESLKHIINITPRKGIISKRRFKVWRGPGTKPTRFLHHSLPGEAKKWSHNGATLLSPTTTFNRPLVNQIGGAPITIGREPCGRRGVLLSILKKFMGKQFIESIPDVFL
jgi:hypothetical protein